MDFIRGFIFFFAVRDPEKPIYWDFYQMNTYDWKIKFFGSHSIGFSWGVLFSLKWCKEEKNWILSKICWNGFLINCLIDFWKSMFCEILGNIEPKVKSLTMNSLRGDDLQGNAFDLFPKRDNSGLSSFWWLVE